MYVSVSQYLPSTPQAYVACQRLGPLFLFRCIVVQFQSLSLQLSSLLKLIC